MRWPNVSTTMPSRVATTAAGRTFMAGVPMKVATVRLDGAWKIARGGSIWSARPRSITATRVDIVIASTWS